MRLGSQPIAIHQLILVRPYYMTWCPSYNCKLSTYSSSSDDASGRTRVERLVERGNVDEVMSDLPHLLLRRLVASDKNVPVYLHRVAGHYLAAYALAQGQGDGGLASGGWSCGW